MFVMIPTSDGLTTIVIFVEAPAARSPRLYSRTLDESTAVAAGVEEINVALCGIQLVSIVAAAVAGPASWGSRQAARTCLARVTPRGRRRELDQRPHRGPQGECDTDRAETPYFVTLTGRGLAH